jgi:putative ABC transport system permease protein
MRPGRLIRAALHGVLANRLRAALTMLGVVIGVASVIVMLSLGNGARAAVDEDFRSLGSDEIQITERKILKDGQFVPAGQTLSYLDGLNLPAAVSQVDWIDITVFGPGRVRYARNTVAPVYLGVTADGLRSMAAGGEVRPVGWPEYSALEAADFLGEGRFFTPAEVLEGAQICVLGYQTALDLFEGDDPLNATVWVNRRPCTVIGVLVQLEPANPAERYTRRVNDGFYLPVSFVVKNLFEQEPSVLIEAHVKDPHQIDQTRLQIAGYLRSRHQVEKDEHGNSQDDFDLTTRADVLGAQMEAARTFSLLLAAMAVVSLLVGGIGIMNVMLVSVTERTREIGVRLAIGAREQDIIGQFLLEATLISAAGGALGVMVGILVIPLAASLNQGIALLAVSSIPLAFGVALLTGLGFGLYPAVRAARLNPIEALRYE